MNEGQPIMHQEEGPCIQLTSAKETVREIPRGAGCVRVP